MLTMVTRTGTSSPLAQAIACFTLRMSLRPAAVCFFAGGFLVWLRIISFNSFSCIAKRAWEATVSGFVCRLGKDSPSHSWRRSACPADLSHAAGPGRQLACFRVGSQVRDQSVAFGLRQDRLGVVHELFGFYHRHRRHHCHTLFDYTLI